MYGMVELFYKRDLIEYCEDSIIVDGCDVKVFGE